jgi:hypothetical protein
VVSTSEGVPQGSPLSPLLSNIVLDELDSELERRGHRFVRYADDCNIYVRSERAGQRVMASVVSFIERRLRLKVNASKSAVAHPEERHFVGFRLRREPLNGEVEVLLSKRSKERIDERVRELTPRNWGSSLRACIRGLNAYLLGWLGFFGICSDGIERTLSNLDAHIRRRLRAIQLRHWEDQTHNSAQAHHAWSESETGVVQRLHRPKVEVGDEPHSRSPSSTPERVFRRTGARITAGPLPNSLQAHRRPGPASAGVGIGRGREPAGRKGQNLRSRRAGCEQHLSGSVRGAPGKLGAPTPSTTVSRSYRRKAPHS